jgi:hypothetical protein
MCLSSADYVEARVYSRLRDRNVKPEKARGIARKVRRNYERRRLERLRAISDRPVLLGRDDRRELADPLSDLQE